MSSLRYGDFYILKAHGSIEQIDTIVLGKNDYRQLMHGNVAYRTHLQNVFSTKTVLFIGYSLTDPDLELLLDEWGSIAKGFVGTHYALMDIRELSSIEQRRLSRDYGIVVLPYQPSNNTHPEVGAFLTELMSKIRVDNVITSKSRVSQIPHSDSSPEALKSNQEKRTQSTQPQSLKLDAEVDVPPKTQTAGSNLSTGILKINLAQPLRYQLRRQSKLKLARKIGVSSQTLNAMINDDWQYITRDAIERVAAYLQLNAREIFEFIPVEFWEPIVRSNTFTFLRGAHASTDPHVDLQIALSDDVATNVIASFLRESLPDFYSAVFAIYRQDEEALLTRVRHENCVVIGSPKSNAAAEILLSRFFNAEPFNPSESNRRKIPFAFCWPDHDPIVETSSLACSTQGRRQARGRTGIALKDGRHIVADYVPLNTYEELAITNGKDCGLIFVANDPFGTSHHVKLIVLAGLSGMGTLAAANALLHDFRYLEPIGDEQCVYGIVEGRYEKRAHSMERKFRSFSWQYRKGGPWPIVR